MDNYSTALQNIYFKLQANIIREEKTRGNPILWTLISFSQKKSEKYIFSSSVTKSDFPEDVLFYLKDHGYLISHINDEGVTEYILSAKGIWEIDKITHGYSDEILFDLIQQNFFSYTSKKKPLDDKDKLVVFSLIALRCFASEITMDLSTNRNRVGWSNIFLESFTFLKDKNIFKNSYSSFAELTALPGSETENVIKYIMRRRNDLSIKTDHIFNNPGNSKYWLNIYNDEHLNSGRLTKLLKLIMPNIPNADSLNETIQFLNETYRDKGKYVLTNMTFLDSRFDEDIKNILRDIYVS